MAILKQSVSYGRAFLMVLSSDGKTGATGKTPVVKLSKNGAGGVTAAGVVTEVDSTNLPGVYFIALTNVDTNTAGDLAYDCTAAGCDHTTFIDKVEPQVFTDLALNASGQVLIASNIKQNQPLNGFPFTMTSATTHAPLPGLGTGITAQRSLGGAGFAPCVFTPTELSNGDYVMNLAASDLNAPTVMLRLTNAAADDLNVLLITQP